MMTPAERKPFKTRLIASMIIWLLLAILVGAFGFIVWTLPGRSEFQLLGKDLPPLSELTLIEGTITKEGRQYTGRRGSFLKPEIEFQVNHQTFQIRTVVSYSPNLFPYQQGQKVEVLYTAAEPQNAWLKWEYDQLFEEYHGISWGLIKEKIGEFYGYLALGILGFSGLFLALNLFFPILSGLRLG